MIALNHNQVMKAKEIFFIHKSITNKGKNNLEDKKKD